MSTLPLKSIFIIGPFLTLDTNIVGNKFKSAQNRLSDLGYHVINPIEKLADLDVQIKALNGEAYNHESDKNEILGICIKAMLSCRYAYLLKDWADSKESILKRHIAMELGLELIYQS